MSEKTYISSAALVWIFLFVGGPMILFGVFGALWMLQDIRLSSWDISLILARGIGFAGDIGLPVAAIAFFKLLMACRNPESKQKTEEHWRRLSTGREPPKRVSVRFLFAYVTCFFAIIPYGILSSLLGVVHFYVGFASYLAFIPLAFGTSRRVLYRIVLGINPSELPRKVVGVTY